MSLISHFDRSLSNLLNWNPHIAEWDQEISRFSPPLDVVEKETGLEASLEVPGIPKNDLKITLDGNLLSVSGSKVYENQTENNRKRVWERRSGTFRRTFQVYNGTRPEDISAFYQDGILKINVKKPEKDVVNNQIYIS